MIAVIALAHIWHALPQVVRMLTAGVADDSPAARRAGVVALVRKLVA